MEENFEGVNESVPAEQTEVSEPEVNEEGTTEEVTEERYYFISLTQATS